MENQTQPQTQPQAQGQMIFKTCTFGGFDKKEVLKYVYDLNDKARQIQEHMQAQVDQVTQERDKLAESLRDLEARLGKTEDELAQAGMDLQSERLKNGELSGMVDSLGEEISKQKQITREKDDEIQAHLAQMQQIKQQNMALEADRQEVEKASAQIGKLMLSARSQADKLMEEAQAEAREIVAEAERSLGDIYAEFAQFRREVSELQDGIVQAVGAISDRADNITQSIAAAEKKMLESNRVSLKATPDTAELTGEELDVQEALGEIIRKTEHAMAGELDSQDTFFRAAAED